MPIRWFTDSPDDGPLCTCSWCGQPILDPFADDAAPTDEELAASEDWPAIRMWTQGEPCYEARFHPRCLNEAVDAGEVELSPHPHVEHKPQ